MSDSEEKTYWIGYDLGGTKMLCSIYDERYERIAEKRRKTKGFDGVEKGLERIIDTIEQTLEKAELKPEQISGLGIGCPGPLDLDEGVMVEAPNLGWKNAKIREHLQKKFPFPAIVLNDVDAGVYGEYRFGAGKSAHCLFGMFPGTGIGGGCVYEGRILRGRRMSCMEVGHVQVMPGGPLSGGGHRGTLEAVGSRLAIAGAVAQAALRGQAPALMNEVGADLSEIRSGALSASVKGGDKVVEKIIRQAAEYIGTSVGGIVHLLAPDVIVLGGGMVEAMPKLFQESVEKAARDFVLPCYRDTFKVVTAQLG
ncbi:MAG: ROK family protein, partial [Planctomycetaceae bacterium]|nr:ROK family protein [Planctomycetaceae bacterium]